MSWWLDKDRDSFSREVATRFALNKPENGRQAYVHKPDQTARSKRGGKGKQKQYTATVDERQRNARGKPLETFSEMWERKRKSA